MKPPRLLGHRRGSAQAARRRQTAEAGHERGENAEEQEKRQLVPGAPVRRRADGKPENEEAERGESVAQGGGKQECGRGRD